MNELPRFDAQAWLAAIVESSDDAIVSKTLEGIITTWNKGAERIFGYTADEMIGQPILRIIPTDRHHEEPRIIEQVRRGERVDHYETVRQAKDGRLIDVSVTISPIRNASGEVIGTSKIARDISDRKWVEAERERLFESERIARGEAERAGRMKDEFLATLSHELRTPLTAILGWSQLLRGGTADAQTQLQGLETIDRNARAQTQIIEDLLDMSRIVSGKLRLDVQRVDLAAAIHAAMETVRPAAEAKNIRLQQVLDPLAGVVSGDPSRLQQVLWNLLLNAIKFTPRGGRVQVLLARINSHVEISITDTGQGIDPAFLPHVFDRFRQADSSSTRTHGGLGLGLAIVKQLVELHGGTVHAQSEGEGQGSTFIVALPITPLRPSSLDEPRRHPSFKTLDEVFDPQLKLSGVRVLVVDDEPDARSLVKRLLDNCQAHVLTAGSADEALVMLAEHPLDVLVSDIGMPRQDGYWLIKNIRKLSRDRGGSIPALALTAYARSEDRQRAILAGFQMHISKPVEPAELVTMVASLAGRT